MIIRRSQGAMYQGIDTEARVDASRKRKILKIETRLANLRVGRIESIPPIRAGSKSQFGKKKIKISMTRIEKKKELRGDLKGTRSRGRLRGRVHRRSAQRGAGDEQERKGRGNILNCSTRGRRKTAAREVDYSSGECRERRATNRVSAAEKLRF